MMLDHHPISVSIYTSICQFYCKFEYEKHIYLLYVVDYIKSIDTESNHGPINLYFVEIVNEILFKLFRLNKKFHSLKFFVVVVIIQVKKKLPFVVDKNHNYINHN